jgi:phosphonate transport system substrate-binding protein
VNALLTTGQLDVALICTGGYLALREQAPDSVEILAVPVAEGSPTYESLIVVPATSPARTVADLVGKRFAFTDELSFSGHSYPRRLIADMGQDPDRFFSKAFFTHSHDRSIAAVGQGLADGAAVHSIVLARRLRDEPALAQRLRVLHRSPPFGAMPVVASTRLDPGVRAALREAFLRLSREPEGVTALQALGLDRFEPPRPGLYDSAERVVAGLK